MERNYIKFINGQGHDLTTNKPYLYQVITGDLLRIIDDAGYELRIYVKNCIHIGKNKWIFCDYNGNI